MVEHKIRKGNLVVSLTSDAYDYNDKQFTLEVTLMEGDEGVENDADVSGLEIGATQEDIHAYLQAAMACAMELSGPETEMNVRNVAGKAAQRACQHLANR